MQLLAEISTLKAQLALGSDMKSQFTLLRSEVAHRDSYIEECEQRLAQAQQQIVSMQLTFQSEFQAIRQQWDETQDQFQVRLCIYIKYR